MYAILSVAWRLPECDWNIAKIKFANYSMNIQDLSLYHSKNNSMNFIPKYKISQWAYQKRYEFHTTDNHTRNGMQSYQ